MQYNNNYNVNRKITADEVHIGYKTNKKKLYQLTKWKHSTFIAYTVLKIYYYRKLFRLERSIKYENAFYRFFIAIE